MKIQLVEETRFSETNCYFKCLKGHNSNIIQTRVMILVLLPTLIDVLIAFSVRHCSQFKVRNQSDSFNRVALFWRQPKTCERAGYRRHLNYNFYCRRLVTCIVPFTSSVTKSDICHHIFAKHL